MAVLYEITPTFISDNIASGNPLHIDFKGCQLSLNLPRQGQTRMLEGPAMRAWLYNTAELIRWCRQREYYYRVDFKRIGVVARKEDYGFADVYIAFSTPAEELEFKLRWSDIFQSAREKPDQTF